VHRAVPEVVGAIRQFQWARGQERLVWLVPLAGRANRQRPAAIRPAPVRRVLSLCRGAAAQQVRAEFLPAEAVEVLV